MNQFYCLQLFLSTIVYFKLHLNVQVFTETAVTIKDSRYYVVFVTDAYNHSQVPQELFYCISLDKKEILIISLGLSLSDVNVKVFWCQQLCSIYLWRLSTELYYKATDTRQYLDYTSNHPRHIKRNIPYNLACRICTTVDDIETKNARLKELEDILSKRGYPKEIITIGINKAGALNQKELKTPQPRQATANILTFVTTFNPNNPSMTSPLHTQVSQYYKAAQR